jgi:putative transposase
MASFRNIYTALMLGIARSTQKELARQVSYLKAENQMLRSRMPAKISLTQREKNRLVRFAKNLGIESVPRNTVKFIYRPPPISPMNLG